MTEHEMIQGYEAEINYQKHMLENLGRWLTLLTLVAGLGIVLIYSFRQKIYLLSLLGILLALVGILGMLLFGYGIYKGRKNLAKVIDDFEEKLKVFRT